ncbi:Eco57I restriction-modification methylase domain-containing protein [Glycomyces albidus]|uniref:site-specific DNA-methyltransferase (adenine-specific) n=1 Tax=Glycomyces albidus TaxID=2656774 RepID=A0A6L5GAS6_9ACTN|nr:class I SAM-dependent DNA methyltransferase [Glycomyces albidus]MQM26754.1 class I SAM-dependent DNA methyltransferase [Glycomyces albidus]
MLYDSILNSGEYFTNYYLEELLPGEVAKTYAKAWNETDRTTDGVSPRKRLLDLRAPYQRARTAIVNAAGEKNTGEEDAGDDGAGSTGAGGRDEKRDAALNAWHRELLAGLGFTAAEPETVELTNCGETREITLAYQSKTVFAVECDFRELAGDAADLAQMQTLQPGFRDASKLADWLFGIDDNAPKYVLLLCGGVVVTADVDAFREGRYLAVSIGTVLERNDKPEAGLATALVAREMLEPQDAAEPDATGLDSLVAQSRTQAQGVSKSLREGLRRSVEIIAKEVLDRLREQEFDWTPFFTDREFADRLAKESLRYLYRILFLLFAEARPELRILPTDSPDYQSGYSIARLGRTVERELGEESREGTYLYESLALLFKRVNDGYHFDDSEAEGKARIVFEPLQSRLFDPASITLIGKDLTPSDDDYVWQVDTRLRNKALHRVLRMLMIDDGTLTGKRGRRGQTQFISYAKLGINQLGAVYEGLMSYTGRIARGETLYEVAQAQDLKKNNGQAKDGSWLIPESAADEYPAEVFVTVEDPYTGDRSPVTYPDGSFVYRLAGRDRETSASFYTPLSLTKATVELTVRQLIEEHGGKVEAKDLLKWKILEPALGSGAFLNEAINQVAAKYLELRQTETGERVDPDKWEEELRKVKAYIALHNSYGVDLNATATELAEVSLWLNVMYPGLKAPWFGLHLRHGNSLIGARRETYGLKDLAPTKGKQFWYDFAPQHDKPSETPAGDLGEDRIHHFLLPSKGWAAIADHKEAKALAGGDAKALGKWRNGLMKKLNKKQLERAQRLARQVEYLWGLVIRRLELSEEAISRDINVWGAPECAEHSGNSAITKEQVLEDLERPGSPFWRLKKLMDSWCALWFWPVGRTELLTGPEEVYPAPGGPGHLRDLDEWFKYCEAITGNTLPGDFFGKELPSDLDALTDHEDQLDAWTGWQHYLFLEQNDQKFAFITELDRIISEQHFFHWELQFAHVFGEGGFDLQVGNPPWYRPEWKDKSILSEIDPHFTLSGWNDSQKRNRKEVLLSGIANRDYFLGEVANNAGLSAFVGNTVTYNLLSGTQPNLYRCFMMRSWANSEVRGAIGLIHPDSHLIGAKEGRLRAATYPRLRIHAYFLNQRLLFEDQSNKQDYGIHISASVRKIDFLHMSWLFDPSVILASLDDDGQGDIPGMRFNGTWDIRAHAKRVIRVDAELLAEWSKLPGKSEVPVEETKILYPVTIAELDPIVKLAEVPQRLGDLDPDISSGFHESADKKAGYFEDIDKSTRIKDKFSAKCVDSWSEVILQGPHFSISTPFSKSPRTPLKSNKDWDPIDLTSFAVDSIPQTNYRRSVDVNDFLERQDKWVDYQLWEQLKRDLAARERAENWLRSETDTSENDITDEMIDACLKEESKRPYTNFWRMAWREMADSNNERSLYPVLIPPGPAHVDAVHSARLPRITGTITQVGICSSLLLDYYLRVTGTSHLKAGNARNLPAVSESHPLATALRLRAARLNCLTTAYSELWKELSAAEEFELEDWAFPWPGLRALNEPGNEWSYHTPLRTDYERRAALIEIDAIVAIMLGITADQLKAIYTARFPVLSGREEQTWFDAEGNKLCGDTKAAGYKQAHAEGPDGSRDAKLPFQQLSAYLAGDRDEGPSGFPRFSKSYSLAYYRANRLGMEPDSEYPQGLNGNAEADRLGEYAYAHKVFSERLAKLTGEKS